MSSIKFVLKVHIINYASDVSMNLQRLYPQTKIKDQLKNNNKKSNFVFFIELIVSALTFQLLTTKWQ